MKRDAEERAIQRRQEIEARARQEADDAIRQAEERQNHFSDSVKPLAMAQVILAAIEVIT